MRAGYDRGSWLGRRERVETIHDLGLAVLKLERDVKERILLGTRDKAPVQVITVVPFQARAESTMK